jgi:hypothetical protein
VDNKVVIVMFVVSLVIVCLMSVVTYGVIVLLRSLLQGHDLDPDDRLPPPSDKCTRPGYKA